MTQPDLLPGRETFLFGPRILIRFTEFNLITWPQWRDIVNIEKVKCSRSASLFNEVGHQLVGPDGVHMHVH
jgi:hypothetical protein